ncbi:high affinity sulfate transporter-related protein [Cryptosporidium ubiquitum]|uniref:High affinity sulfate transporter-related protein n=1 Tax=Cryptosporidium ubiquitum TaxID=857276 RepID=A0A1J4MI43_9CRYT|nr:high affinity sulfate transporter-related protein [Cryptosporidium ubiquitum]OII73880.1 high affinity sulfate transporter-related protein [Cryptosporidium ubiquitum]
MDENNKEIINDIKINPKSGLTKEWDEFLSLYHQRSEEINNDFKLHSRFYRRSKSGWRSFLSVIIKSIHSFFLNESLIGIKYLKQAKWTWSNVICDFFCGLAEAALSIPQGLSYSSLANVVPSMGLCNGILQPIIYLFIGSSLYISIGVNSVESIVAGTAIDNLVGNGASLEVRSEVCSVVILFHGISCCLLRIFGLAHFVDFLSDSVLQGFLSGVAFSIIVKELPFMLAIEPPNTNCVPIRAFFILLDKLPKISWHATIFSIFTILFLETIIWIKEMFKTNFPVPSQLIVIIIANVASAFVSPNIPMIGKIPKSTLLIPNNVIWSQPPNTFPQPTGISSLPFFARAWIAALPLTFISFFTHYSAAQSMEIRAHKLPERPKDSESNSKEMELLKEKDEIELDKNCEYSKQRNIQSTSTSVQLPEKISSETKTSPRINIKDNTQSSLERSQGDLDQIQDFNSSLSPCSYKSSVSPSSSSSVILEEERRISLSIRFESKSSFSNSQSAIKNKLNSKYSDLENYQPLRHESSNSSNVSKTPQETFFDNMSMNECNTDKSKEAELNILNSTSSRKKHIESRSLFSVGTEILVLGVINIVGAFFNCLPGAGSLARTNLNFTLGVKSPLHNVVYSMGVLLVAMFLLEYIRFLPEAVLGAIIAQAMIRMVNIKYFVKLVKMRSIDSVFWMIAFIGTVTTGMTYGIIFALVSSVIYLIKYLYRPKFEILGKLPGTLIFKSMDKFPQAVQLPYVRIARFEGPLTFINAERFIKNLEKMVEVWLDEDLRISNRNDYREEAFDEYLVKNQYFPSFTSSTNFGERIPTIIQDLNENHVERVIIIDACMINEIDYTALQVLQRFNNQAKKLNIQLWFASFSHPNSSFLLRSGFYEIIPLVHCFVDLSEAVAAAQICIGQRYSSCI